MKLSKPFKNCTINSVSQGYSETHRAVDFFGNYGTFLVAPCNGRVCKIITDTDIYDEFWQDFKRGYGIIIQEDDSNRYHLYWHCGQVFPVNMWQRVEQGKTVIAMMGNSGLCYSHGAEVKQEDKLKPPYPGTHLHQEMFILEENGQRTYLNPLTQIDWGLKIGYSLLDTIKQILDNIMRLFR